ncbi:MAG: hypothetical protein K6D97_08890 [Clostridia bacterium]|nr:hypothetical protein [Clostridia bacterium]
MKKRVGILIVVLMMIFAIGCRQSEVVSRNISKNADNFNVTRRLTVINMRTDKILLCMTGKMSIQNEGNDEIAVIVEVDHKRQIYQKHLIYLNDWTMYTVEDISGVRVSRYDYEIEFMPERIIPVKFTADELAEEWDDIVESDDAGNGSAEDNEQ